MVYFFYFPRCTTKSMIYALFIVSLCVFLHLLFVNYALNLANNVNSIFLGAKRLTTIKSSDTKYILLWTQSFHNHLLINNEFIFPSLNCSTSNCVFTKDKSLFDGDYTRFDAILFNDDILNSKDRPIKRNQTQIYIFNTLESSYTVPACELNNDGFFNLTLTYRLDSDIPWSYFIVRNVKGAIVAPKVSVRWRRSFRPVNPEIRSILAGKQKAAAWLVSHCKADSLRDEYLTRLQEHLFHFGLKIDVYGKCSQKKCPNDDCDEIIKRDYYFYMAFENSLSEDYVTEKVLHGYNNYAVPVVYGGANYTRFLPPGSYINAREMHPYNLAFAMYQAIQTPAMYQTYFEWTNLYTISANFKSHHPLCKLCTAINQRYEYPNKDKFRLWWNGLNGMKWCLSKDYWNETANVNIDARHVFKLY